MRCPLRSCSFHQFRLPSIAGFLVAGAFDRPAWVAPDSRCVSGPCARRDRHRPVVVHDRYGVFVRALCGAPFADGGGSCSNRRGLDSGRCLGRWPSAFRISREFSGDSPRAQQHSDRLESPSEQGESDSFHGRATVAILIFQDLAVVPMMLITPILATPQRECDGMCC